MILLLFSSTVSLASTSPAETRQRLEQVRAQIETLRNRLEAARGERGRLETQLRQAEQAVNRAGQDLAAAEARLEHTSERIRTLEHQEQIQQRELEAQHGMLVAQLRHAYLSGRQDQLKLLLSLEDPAEVQRMLVYHKHFSQARGIQIDAATRALEELVATRHALEEVRAQQALERNTQQALQQDLTRQRQARADALEALRRDIARDGRQLSQLEADQAALEELLRSLDAILSDIPDESLLDTPFAQQRGRLARPVDGALRHAFGSNRGTSTGQRWRGVVFEASRGTSVRAVHHGRVAFADWMPGFGMLVIIDHGENYLTLYGFNESLDRSAGDWVMAGDVVARAGDSGGQAQAGLYFEIRHKGQPVNPAPWWDSKQRVTGAR